MRDKHCNGHALGRSYQKEMIESRESFTVIFSIFRCKAKSLAREITSDLGFRMPGTRPEGKKEQVGFSGEGRRVPKMSHFWVSPALARKDCLLLLPLSIFGESTNSGLVPGSRDPNLRRVNFVLTL